MQRQELLARQKPIKQIRIKFGKILFKFIKRFNKFSILKHYICTFLAKFAISDWMRFKKVQLKQNVYSQH